MAHAIVTRVINCEPVDKAGVDNFRIYFEVILGDLAGCRVQKVQVSIDIAPTDTVAIIATNLGSAVRTRATSFGYTIPANGVIAWQVAFL